MHCCFVSTVLFISFTKPWASYRSVSYIFYIYQLPSHCNGTKIPANHIPSISKHVMSGLISLKKLQTSSDIAEFKVMSHVTSCWLGTYSRNTMIDSEKL